MPRRPDEEYSLGKRTTRPHGGANAWTKARDEEETPKFDPVEAERRAQQRKSRNS